jgi:hypothetical protein
VSELVALSVSELVETLERGERMPHVSLACHALLSLLWYVMGFVGGWIYLVRPAARTLLGIELNEWPLPWGHGEYWALRDGQWVRDGGLLGVLRARVMRSAAEGTEGGLGGGLGGGVGGWARAGVGGGGGWPGRGVTGDADDDGEGDGTDESDASSDDEVEVAWRRGTPGGEGRRGAGAFAAAAPPPITYDQPGSENYTPAVADAADENDPLYA